MGIDIRLPNITASTEREQLVQMKSYLFQLAEQLQWALQNVDTSNNTVAVTPTPKSLPSSSQTTASPEATFGSIKALIIKSADIVNAYYDEINTRLEGVYVAESDFGTFQQLVTNDITSNATNTNNAFTNIQAIQSHIDTISGTVEDVKTGIDNNLKTLNAEIDGLDSALDEAKENIDSEIEDLKKGIENVELSLIEVNANIKTGLLYYDENEIPVYGLEVGQKTIVDGEEVFNKFARFTANRLSFYDQNGSEVAYISDYKLYICNVEITSSLTIGGYIDTVTASGGVITKWVGRG